MAKPLLPDELWAEIEPLLPPESPKPKGSRARISDRAVLTGILFVLKSGIAWEMLPHEMGCSSGMTCWRRLQEWQEAGVWDALVPILLHRLAAADRIDWRRAALDAQSVPAPKGSSRRDRTRRIGANRAPSATASSTARACRRRGIPPRIARRGIESAPTRGRLRWVVACPFAWLNRSRRLRVRDERRADIHEACLKWRCAMIRFPQRQKIG